ncbi:MAG: hypothetical protein HW384_1384, partial [Dehalococcoidia bacterium]|nr:hypothetical protein [Dehalococcoidia bacterium]
MPVSWAESGGGAAQHPPHILSPPLVQYKHETGSGYIEEGKAIADL